MVIALVDEGCQIKLTGPPGRNRTDISPFRHRQGFGGHSRRGHPTAPVHCHCYAPTRNRILQILHTFRIFFSQTRKISRKVLRRYAHSRLTSPQAPADACPRSTHRRAKAFAGRSGACMAHAPFVLPARIELASVPSEGTILSIERRKR